MILVGDVTVTTSIVEDPVVDETDSENMEIDVLALLT